MLVSDYLTWKQIKPYQLAKAAKVRIGLIYEIVKSEQNGIKPNMRLSTAMKIVNACGGSVRLEDLA